MPIAFCLGYGSDRSQGSALFLLIHLRRHFGGERIKQ